MLFSEKKLRELANLPETISINDIVNAINSIGFEVEKYEFFNKNENLKFGHVINTYKNPNSEKLTVCEIEFDDKKRIIQTAATNVKKNDYVIAFIPGSKLNNIEIKEKEMAKIISEGMIASLSELGFKDELLTKELRDGVFILDKVDLKNDPIKFLKLDDHIIEVSILSNRSDAQSYDIFSQELAAYFHSKPLKKFDKYNKETFQSKIKIEANANNDLHGMEVMENNFKINYEDMILLLKSNIKLSENKLINFSNIAMVMTGVSLRCFDAEKIGNNLQIKEKENIVYLSDDKNHIAILGVEELEHYRATNSSKKILFEFSQIDEKIVRNNSKNTKITTNSSINNSRTISIGALNRTSNLISQYFKEHSQLINPLNIENKKIKFEKDYIIKYAGFDIIKNENYKRAIKSLEILDFKFDKYVSIPTFRHDIKNMQNIVEEIFRFYGLNNFEPKTNEVKPLLIDPINPIEKIISSLGYSQVWTYTLINKEKNNFNPFKFTKNFNLIKYVSEEYNAIRNSIALPLLNIFEYNKKRKIENISLFDLGMINDKNALIIASDTKDYASIKNDLEKISNQKFEVKKLDNEFLHPNYNAGLFLGGQLVGWIGKFNPFKIDSNVIFGEILIDCIYKPNNKFIEFDNNPLKERDITFEIEKDFENAIYLNTLNSIDGIYSINLLSTYQVGNKNKITYRILMSEDALVKFEQINWNDKEKLF